MLLPCLCRILIFRTTSSFTLGFSTNLKDLFSEKQVGTNLCILLFLSSRASFLSVQRDFWYIPLFCSKISYIDINVVTKNKMQIIYVFSLCLLLYLITFGLKFITLLSSVTDHPCVLLYKRASPMLFPGVHTTICQKQQHRC